MQPVDNLIISGSSDNVNSPFIGPPAHPATLSGVCVIVGLYTLKKVRFQYKLEVDTGKIKVLLVGDSRH
jgi:hypothetical protein